MLSLSTRSNGRVNPKLMRSIRVWQWRWMNSKTKSLMEVTGRALKDRVAMWDGKKNRRVLRKKFPVIYRLSSKKHFKIPGNLEPILGHESVVSLWRKRHVFKKPSKRWRGFPPGGKYMILFGCVLWVCSLVWRQPVVTVNCGRWILIRSTSAWFGQITVVDAKIWTFEGEINTTIISVVFQYPMVI